MLSVMTLFFLLNYIFCNEKSCSFTEKNVTLQYETTYWHTRL